MASSIPWVAPIRRIPDPLGWNGLPRLAQGYVAVVTLAGTVAFILSMPHRLPDPLLLGGLLLLACVTSAWKVTLPMSLASGATLSVSYAADLMTLLLLGPEAAVIVAVAGAWMQCTFKVKQTYPLYRTAFSMSCPPFPHPSRAVLNQSRSLPNFFRSCKSPIAPSAGSG